VKAIEGKKEAAKAKRLWRDAFAKGAERVDGLGGTVLWHERLGLWGMFGTLRRRDGSERDWNPFGQLPSGLRSNMIVEINPPRGGRNLNLQGAFAADDDGQTWLLHQGRMSVPGSRVTEDDFANATGLRPVSISFADGTEALFHPVALLNAPPAAVQESIATFVAHCARVRLARSAPSRIVKAVERVQNWERGLSPEKTGNYETGARDGVIARRRHAEVWRALARELKSKGIAHTNERVARYGPDLYTFEDPLVLFEIKSNVTSGDLFEGVGQLQIYERLLELTFRKVIVVPEGLKATLADVLPVLGVKVVEYRREGRGVRFDAKALTSCLAP
jgi:hypothetical protein